MEKMKNILCTAVLLLCLQSVVWSSREEEHCTQTYETPTKLICYVCPPGSFKRENCTKNNTGDLCQGCPANTYQKTCNIAEYCADCKPLCKAPFTIKVKNCTLYNDIVCECQDGRYWKKETKTDGGCALHDLCGPSYGMVKRGNQYSNTVCKKCIAGETFSNESSLDGCKACTTCKEYKTNCTPESDAVCLIENETETASIPTQTTEDFNLYIVATAILAALSAFLCILLIIIFWVVRRLRGKNTTVEDGREMPPILDGPIAPNGVGGGGGGADREREPPDNPADQPPEETSSIESTSGTQDSDDPPSDSEEDNGAEGGLDTQNSLEDQDADELSSIASTSRDSQNGEGATSIPEHDIYPDDVTQQGQREDEDTNLYALEDGEGSMKEMSPTQDNPNRLPRLISQPAESMEYPYNSSEYVHVHIEDVHVIG